MKEESDIMQKLLVGGPVNGASLTELRKELDACQTHTGRYLDVRVVRLVVEKRGAILCWCAIQFEGIEPVEV